MYLKYSWNYIQVSVIKAYNESCIKFPRTFIDI